MLHLNRAHEVLNVLLYFASEKGSKSVPFDWEWLTTDVAAALYEHLTQKEAPVWLLDGRKPGDQWVNKLNQMIGEVLQTHGRKITPTLRKAFLELLFIKYPSEGATDHGTYAANEIRHWWHDMIHSYSPGKWFQLSVDDIRSVEELIKDFGGESEEYCQEISKVMQKYIDRRRNPEEVR